MSPSSHPTPQLEKALQTAEDLADKSLARMPPEAVAAVAAVAQGVLDRLPGIRKSLDSALSDEEARMVFKVIEFSGGGFTGQGHWYTCPNGHVYVIGECGGAMEESTCPECGARIGGGGHALRADNRHATEFLSRAAAGGDGRQ